MAFSNSLYREKSITLEKSLNGKGDTGCKWDVVEVVIVCLITVFFDFIVKSLPDKGNEKQMEGALCGFQWTISEMMSLFSLQFIDQNSLYKEKALPFPISLIISLYIVLAYW